MPDTRRQFLQSAALAGGVAGAGWGAAAGTGIQVPKMKFFNLEISRLVLGVNQFYGYSHFNGTYSQVMRDYYTPERVCDVMNRCTGFGINALNYAHVSRAQQDLERFRAAGGKMHLIVQGTGDDPLAIIRAVKPEAMYCQGEKTDRAFQNGELDTIREWCKKVRGAGVITGLGTHKPEVIAQAESEGWDVDFYAGCVYNRSRTTDEWKELFHGELPEMPGEIYIKSDPERMYKVMRTTPKPCFAFKILAAGRVSSAEQAFRTAFESIKPTDGVFVGMFPLFKDEVKENAERVHRILSARS